MEELKIYLQKLQTELGPAVLNAVKSTIDSESEEVYELVKQRTPVSDKAHAHLVDSLQKTPVNTFGRYGYKINYEGYNEYGVPYSLIARALNKGTATRAGTHHIDYAFSRLKGLDERLNEAATEAMNKFK